MKLLLDTHVLLWWLANKPISELAQQSIANLNHLIFVSAASAWEIAIKKSIGKLKTPDDLTQQIENNDFLPLPMTLDRALAVGKLPWHHKDFFDRMIIAQAQEEGMQIVTRDRKFTPYSVSTIAA
ncbi:MAG: type II toxin-antitoxin system VapC family toxin [Cyanophyceae cyanobacterium]